MNCKKELKFVVYLLFFLTALINANAGVDSVMITQNCPEWADLPACTIYDYAVISREYDVFILGTNLQDYSNDELTLIENIGSSARYKFTSGNSAGLKNFGELNINVLSEADELLNSIGNIKIDVNDINSTVAISNLNLTDKIIRIVNLTDVNDLEGFRYNLDVDLLLDGLTYDLDFIEGNNYPNYNTLHFDGSASNILGAILHFNDLKKDNGEPLDVDDINTNSILFNQVLDAYDANEPITINAKAMKQENNFMFYTDEGYSNLGSSDLENLQNIINEKIRFVSPEEIIDALMPIADFSGFTSFIDFSISVDFNNLRLEDGTYNLDLNYEDKYGNTGSKSFTVQLDVTNIAPPINATNGTVEFTDPIINQTLERIENLPENVSITAVLFGEVKPGSFAEINNEIKDVLNFMQINISQDGITGSFDLFFNVDKTLINSNDKSNVVLYVEENNTWIALFTALVNETTTNYKYKGTIPHFSNFMIAVKQADSSSPSASSSGSGSSSSSDNDEEDAPAPNPVPIQIPKQEEANLEENLPVQEINNVQEEQKGFLAITGAAIANFIKSNPLAATFFGLIGIFGGLMVYSLLFARRRVSKEEIEELIKNNKK